MKHNFIRYSMIVLLIGLVALTSDRANAQGSQKDKQIELLISSWGIAPGLTARVSVAHFGDGSVRFVSEGVSARIQILDLEGEVLELIDSGTGRTVSYIPYNPYITVDYIDHM